MFSLNRPSIGRESAAQRTCFAAIVIAGLSAPASAAYTNLYGNVDTSGAGPLQQSIPDVPDASLSGVRSQDAVGNDAIANGTMAALAGNFRLSSHACSGGQVGWGGQANARAHADVTLDYRVDSATLAPGTPVSLRIRWAVNGSATAAGSLTY